MESKREEGKDERIHVAIRVRPPLKAEVAREEAVLVDTKVQLMRTPALLALMLKFAL